MNVFRNIKKITSNYGTIRFYSTSKQLTDVDINKIRNLGILAHIDAGKTTTTERMLFYSGKIKQMGEVHHGNTVTDYMAQERERGITIKSAAITFNWKNHRFNLIDTPGHIDFTMEVEETLSVLDGVVVILDGSAGVEAQTLTVWRQADRYKIPRIVFVNKMDRSDANLKSCCDSVERKLEKPTLCLQLPIWKHGKLRGLIDVLTMEKLLPTNHILDKIAITEENDPELWNLAKQARSTVINKLGDFNDDFANKIIAVDSVDNIKTTDIQETLRRVTLEQIAVPVLCGSAYKNLGVQPLMDSVILYLPSPNERNNHFKCFKDALCARAFKIIHDKQKGPLVFFRIYSGIFNKNQKMYNISQERNEQAGRLYVAYADEFQDIDHLDNGNIAVVSGLKQTTVGDLVAQSVTTANNAKKEMVKTLKDKSSGDLIQKVFGSGTKIPEPVFFCSIEPPSLAYQASLEQALIELQREDPSLRVTHDSETGQTVLAGMGELHLEIIKDRILKEYKIEADLGSLQIAYREAPIMKASRDFTIETKIGNTKHMVAISFSLIPTSTVEDEKDILKLDKTPEAASNLANIFPKHLLAIKRGVDVAVSHGPKINSQVVNAQVMLHRFEVGRGTSETMIAAAATQCIQKLLIESGTNVLEPIMSLEIVAPEELVSTILADLSRRRSIISNITMRGNNKVINCETPLAELLGYSTTLRTITSGTATFTMEFLDYKIMSTIDENKAIESVRGF
ncbi:hypothetical protein ILUMI_10884 [Ignelater luminosus]|uniref:Tr-type G domain-containing protein n=1 Tax=Ignelater luminosus TaxID=2038154 RepID=A0A8K0GEG8_IGNLU|nr:hypothetical protein ILUMI_10884 [Ignelater luminosus]